MGRGAIFEKLFCFSISQLHVLMKCFFVYASPSKLNAYLDCSSAVSNSIELLGLIMGSSIYNGLQLCEKDTDCNGMRCFEIFSPEHVK